MRRRSTPAQRANSAMVNPSLFGSGHTSGPKMSAYLVTFSSTRLRSISGMMPAWLARAEMTDMMKSTTRLSDGLACRWSWASVLRCAVPAALRDIGASWGGRSLGPA